MRRTVAKYSRIARRNLEPATALIDIEVLAVEDYVYPLCGDIKR